MRSLFFAFLLFWALAASCAAAPVFSTVFVVMEENHGYSQVVGDSSMPYFNSLIASGGLSTNQYANAHPSLPNYLTLTSGSNDGVTKDSCYNSIAPITADNVVRELTAKGITWRAYLEGLPARGSLVCNSGEYVVHHNPFLYYSDVRSSKTQQLNMFPSTQLASDISHRTFARFNYIVPDACDNMHGDSGCANGCRTGSESACYRAADNWLSTNVRPLLSSSIFGSSGSAVLIIIWDEGVGTTHGGGQVAAVFHGPHIKPNFKSTVFHQHQAVCHETLEGLGVTHLPAGCGAVADMSEFFSR